MQEALRLAHRGAGSVHPNPLVGAILVANGAIVGRGWHERCGGPHAEVNAISDARKNGSNDFPDATLYVTLEPCCHTGRTPPCTELIISSGIRAVVAGMRDPNPRVSGRGFEALRAAGLAVTEPVLETECREINRAFIKYVTTKRPYILLKMAMTLDGKTVLSGYDDARHDGAARGEGSDRWISSPASRTETHRIRSEMTAVMCGIGTVLADDPELNVRHVEGRDPVRIIADGNFRIPITSKIAQSARKQRTIVAGLAPAEGVRGDAARRRIAVLENTGIEILTVARAGGLATANADPAQDMIDLDELMRKLGRLEIDSILLEGGATLASAAVSAGIVDRVLFYAAPILGDGTQIRDIRTRESGGDAVIEGDIHKETGVTHVHGNH